MKKKFEFDLQRFATNKIPELINDMRAYIDGSDDMISVKTLELPELASPTEDVTGIGVMGTISAPVHGHFDSGEATLTWQVPTKTSTQLVGGAPISLDAYADRQGFDGGENKYEHIQYHVVIKGRVKSHNPGTLEAQKAMESTTTIEYHYLKISLNGEELCEIDKYGYKCVINGVDLMGIVRSNLGMS